VLQRYIESQLAARLGKEVDEGRQRLSRQQQEELELYKMPEGLEVRCYNMLSNMLHNLLFTFADQQRS
jgi:hypothetical protein